MLNIPINLFWGQYGFQYLVGIDDNTTDQISYQYFTHQDNQNIDNIDYIQFVQSSSDNLERSNNIYNSVPFQFETYRFISYSSDGETEYNNGVVQIIEKTTSDTTVEIIECSDENLIGNRFVVKITSLVNRKVPVYNENNDEIGVSVFIYENNYDVDLLPNDPTQENQTPIKSRKIHFYLPWYKIDNYRKTDYALTFTTWIAGKEIILGNYKITRDNHIAIPYLEYKEERYAECIDLFIIDPWSLIYDDMWKDWRKEVCGEIEGVNNTGSSLHVSITPIEKSENYYNIIPSGNIGSSNITISQISDYFHLNIGFEEDSSDIKLQFEYNNIYDNLTEYLLETYLIDIPEEELSIHYELSISDKEESVAILEADSTEESYVFSKNDFDLYDWSEYKDGLFMYGAADIRGGDIDLISVVSNPLPITPEIYKYLIKTDIPGLKLSLVHMFDYIVNAVNKINKNVVQVENNKDYKAGLIKPVFFQANKLNDTVIHPEVTENINLDLNSYKSKTDFFYLKVEGIIFPEIGRGPNGVIFKIQGNLLPHKVEDGVLYVLNQDKELITTGKFKYIS